MSAFPSQVLRILGLGSIMLALGCGTPVASSHLNTSGGEGQLAAAKQYLNSADAHSKAMVALVSANNEANLAAKVNQLKSQAQTNPEYLRYNTSADGKNLAIASAAGVSVYTLGILPAAAISGATQASSVAAAWFVGTPIVVVGGVVFVGLEGWEWYSVSGNRRALERSMALEMRTRREICALVGKLSLSQRVQAAQTYKTYASYLGYMSWTSYPAALPGKMVVNQLAKGETPYWCQ